MGRDIEGNILDGGRDAAPPDRGFVFGEDGEFCERYDILVARLWVDEVAATFGELSSLTSQQRCRTWARICNVTCLGQICEEVGQVVEISISIVCALRAFDKAVHELVNGERGRRERLRNPPLQLQQP